MKRLLFTLTLLAATCMTWAQGTPFLHNFSSKEYNAHNRNFDILADEKGFVFVANFEGLLYYDNAEWRIIHTPSITRITTLHRDNTGTIWAGGYNYVGYVSAKPNGELTLKNAIRKGSFQGVVEQIWDNGGHIFFKLEKGETFALNDGTIKTVANAHPQHNKAAPIDIGYNLSAVATETDGVAILYKGRPNYTISEANGLCSNAVNKLSYNGKGMLWGATNNGIFCIAVPSTYSHSTANEGLRGEVLSLLEQDNTADSTLYAGTTNGLFYKQGKRFLPVPGISHDSWQMASTPQGLLVATSNGLYRVVNKSNAQQLNSNNTMCVLNTYDGFYTGEPDGVYFNSNGGKRIKIADLERVTKIYIDEKDDFWIQNLYGIIWCKKSTESDFHQVLVDKDKTVPGMLVPTNKSVMAISANQTDPIPYPQFAYEDSEGRTWLTNTSGHELYCMKNGKRLTDLNQQLAAIGDYNVRDMFVAKNVLYMGGDFGLIIFNTRFRDPILEHKPKLHIRTVKLNGDSIIWGGYGVMPKHFSLASDERHLEFTFALDNTILIKKTLYRYRLNNHAWSAWDDEQEAKFPSIEPGRHRFEVQAKDAYGNISEPVAIDFDISFPFYIRWYMNVLYLFIVALLVYLLIRYRLKRLEKEKMRLESIVQERTAEVVKQKDEIEEKSKSLETALKELSNAQNELIRQEKMATVGKLTQGLIDRILNPLNYINNFSKLSQGLVKDIEANMEDDKDNMDEENYEDTMDVLDMLRGNLEKVSEHGANTTRTLKAMEEMLKDRTGGIVETDLCTILRQDEQMLRNYYADNIKKSNIAISFELPDKQIVIDANPDQLSKTIMSLLGNAAYAIEKKAQRQSYQAEILVKLESAANNAVLTFHDNGIGIEQTIIDKIFDPFFTTKTTGEAAGVGLYLSREIVQNYGGDISVVSVKDEYTEFTITLPSKEAETNE